MQNLHCLLCLVCSIFTFFIILFLKICCTSYVHITIRWVFALNVWSLWVRTLGLSVTICYNLNFAFKYFFRFCILHFVFVTSRNWLVRALEIWWDGHNPIFDRFLQICILYLILQEIDWYAHWTFGQMLGLWQSDCREMTVITIDGGDLNAKSSAQMDLLNADM